MKAGRHAWPPQGMAPGRGRPGPQRRYFRMERAHVGVLKCPVNINFAKVIVFIGKLLLRRSRAVVLLSIAPAYIAKTRQRPGKAICRQPFYSTLWILHGY